MKCLLNYLLFILISANCFSQNKDIPEIEAYFTAIVVTDIDKSIAWYSKNFGFEVLSQLNLEEHNLKQVNLIRNGILIELIQIKGTLNKKEVLDKNPGNKFIQGLFKFGFQTNKFDELINLFKTNNVEFYGNVVNDPNTNQRMVIIKDPDQNYLQLFEK